MLFVATESTSPAVAIEGLDVPGLHCDFLLAHLGQKGGPVVDDRLRVLLRFFFVGLHFRNVLLDPADRLSKLFALLLDGFVFGLKLLDARKQSGILFRDLIVLARMKMLDVEMDLGRRFLPRFLNLFQPSREFAGDGRREEAGFECRQRRFKIVVRVVSFCSFGDRLWLP